jgi:hypothetical protein
MSELKQWTYYILDEHNKLVIITKMFSEAMYNMRFGYSILSTFPDGDVYYTSPTEKYTLLCSEKFEVQHV